MYILCYLEYPNYKWVGGWGHKLTTRQTGSWTSDTSDHHHTQAQFRAANKSNFLLHSSYLLVTKKIVNLFSSLHKAKQLTSNIPLENMKSEPQHARPPLLVHALPPSQVPGQPPSSIPHIFFQHPT